MDKQTRKLIKHYMNVNDIESFSELSKLTGICRQTLYDRLDNPDSFKRYEIKALNDVLHFSIEDAGKFILGEKIWES